MARSARSSTATALPARALTSMTLLALAAACSGDAATGVATTPADAGATVPVATAATPTTTALAGAGLWVNPSSAAKQTADAWRASRPADAAQLDKIAAQPQVQWLGNWNADVRADADAATSTIIAAGAVPVFVAYNIPQRDCGGLSGGNSTTADAYRAWIAALASGIGGRRAAVILEPDALAAMDCLSAVDQQLRVDLLSDAVRTLARGGSISVYLDAGHPGWQPAETIASRLTRAGIAMAQGFALNVSNFIATPENLAYGAKVSALVGGRHFVIDTGRNGLGASPDGQWCNPAGRALGERPTTSTGQPLVDAFLWIKAPGESDGACAGAPAAGTWMPDYALGLAQRAKY